MQSRPTGKAERLHILPDSSKIRIELHSDQFASRATASATASRIALTLLLPLILGTNQFGHFIALDF